MYNPASADAAGTRQIFSYRASTNQSTYGNNGITGSSARCIRCLRAHQDKPDNIVCQRCAATCRWSALGDRGSGNCKTAKHTRCSLGPAPAAASCCTFADQVSLQCRSLGTARPTSGPTILSHASIYMAACWPMRNTGWLVAGCSAPSEDCCTPAISSCIACSVPQGCSTCQGVIS